MSLQAAPGRQCRSVIVAELYMYNLAMLIHKYVCNVLSNRAVKLSSTAAGKLYARFKHRLYACTTS